MMTIFIMMFGWNAWAQKTVDEDGQASCAGLTTIDQIICYANQAKKMDNIAVCEQAQDIAVVYQCYAIFAEYKEDAAICEKIKTEGVAQPGVQELKDICYSDIAKKKQDPSLCDEMETVTLRDDCYFQVVQASGHLDVCDKIVGEERRNWCKGEPTYIDN